MSSNMFRLQLNLLQCFICFLLISAATVHSFPSSNLALNNRYQRDTSETVFTTGELDLVLDPGNKFLLFEMCCNKDDGCKEGSFLFCFPATEQNQIGDGLNGCGDRTCSYRVDYFPDNKFGLAGGMFKTAEECFKGKIDDEHMYAIYTNGEPTGEKTNDGCPLDRPPGNRLMLDIKTVPDGVTVKALNAQKYVEPTTLPPTTIPSTEKPDGTEETTKKESSAAGSTTQETGMSDALKFTLIGVGVFVFLLIIGGIAFAIYWFCFKEKKSSKPAPPDTVAKTADATPVTKETAPHVNDKTFEPKQKTTTENETTKDVEHSKHAPSNVRSKHAAVPSNVVSSSAAAAEILPPPPMASEDFTASREPNNNSEYSKTDASNLNKTDDPSPFDNDESGQGGKSASKKSHGQASFSKEVAAALDKPKMKKKKAMK